MSTMANTVKESAKLNISKAAAYTGATLAVGAAAFAIGALNNKNPEGGTFAGFTFWQEQNRNSSRYSYLTRSQVDGSILDTPFGIDIPVNFPEERITFGTELETQFMIDRMVTRVTTDVGDLRDLGKTRETNAEAAGATILKVAMNEIDKLREMGLNIPQGKYDRKVLDQKIEEGLNGGTPFKTYKPDYSMAERYLLAAALGGKGAQHFVYDKDYRKAFRSTPEESVKLLDTDYVLSRDYQPKYSGGICGTISGDIAKIGADGMGLKIWNIGGYTIRPTAGQPMPKFGSTGTHAWNVVHLEDGVYTLMDIGWLTGRLYGEGHGGSGYESKGSRAAGFTVGQQHEDIFLPRSKELIQYLLSSRIGSVETIQHIAKNGWGEFPAIKHLDLNTGDPRMVFSGTMNGWLGVSQSNVDRARAAYEQKALNPYNAARKQQLSGLIAKDFLKL